MGLLHYTQSNQAYFRTEAKTGITHIDRERLNGLANVYSSLVAADEKVYITARNGATLVLEHGRKFEPLATNKLDDRLDVSCTGSNQIFLKRTSVSLFAYESER